MTEYNAHLAPRHLGFDASSYIDPATAARFLEAGYYTAFRYVKLTKKVYDEPQTWPVSLSHQELRELVDAGLVVSLVQFLVAESRGGGHGATNGEKYGDAAGWNAKQLGAPEGITVWCDAEGWESQSRVDILAYLDAWATACAAHGYKPGLYVGGGLPGITEDDLWQRPGFEAYWRAASIVPAVANRGYTVAQMCELEVFGATIDQNWVGLDHRARIGSDRFKVIGK